MATSSSSSSLRDRGSLSPESNASTNLTDISHEKLSLTSLDGEPTFNSDPVDNDSIFIATIPDHENKDPMFLSSWRFCAARLVGLTAVVPELLALFLCRYQLNGLMARWGHDEALTLTPLLISFGLLCNGIIGSLESLCFACVKLGALFSSRQPRLLLLGDSVPSVDVFVTVCSEKLDVVRDTVLGALHIDYPSQRFRVIVTDDGGSATLRDWVTDMMLDHPTLYYHARTQTGGWKAGNLNCAIRFTESLPGGSAECVAGLDADMIPTRGWLRAVTAHLMRSANMGMVCPTQMFYNIPSDDPLYQANTFDWRAKRLIFDLAGNGWNYGSGWIMRRQAVDDIGGFPEDILTEDVSSSAMAMAAGWKTVYLQEAVQYGLVPETYVAHIKQMTRWHVGESQTATKFGFYLSKDKTKLMTPMQKFVQIAQGLNTHIKTPVTMLNLVLLCCVFLTGMPLVHWNDDEQMRFLLRMDAAIVLLRWVHELHYSVVAGYRATLNETCKAIYLSPYCFVSYVRAFLVPARFGGSTKAVSFTPSGSISNAYRERDPRRRAPLWQRLRHHFMGDAGGAWFHLAVSALLLSAVALRVARAVDLFIPSLGVLGRTTAASGGGGGGVSGSSLSLSSSSAADWSGFWVHVLQHVAWPSSSSTWLVASVACLTPLKYAVFPPTTLDRERLMGRRDERGVRYPLASARGRVARSAFVFGFAEVYTCYMVFVLGVFCVV